MNTKKIKNFLYYNWIKIAAAVFVIVLTAVTMRQCASRHETDFGIMYAGSTAVSERLSVLREELEKNIQLDDTDGDNVITARDKAITIPDTWEHTIEQQVMEQIQVEIIAGDYLVYILNEPVLLKYAIDGSFMDITEYAKDISDCLSYENGGVYAIPLSGNLSLEANGIPTDGMYIALRACPDDKENSPEYRNAFKALEYILNNSISAEDAEAGKSVADKSDAEMVRVIMDDGGEFIMELYPNVAPRTVANFIKLVNQKFYDGLTFHRVIEGFMAQGGAFDLINQMNDPADSIKGEFRSNGFDNKLSHTRGVVSMARTNDPNSASSQFFICYDDASFLDGDYAAFGMVTEGMEVVDSFLDSGTDIYDAPLKEVKIKTIEKIN